MSSLADRFNPRPDTSGSSGAEDEAKKVEVVEESDEAPTPASGGGDDTKAADLMANLSVKEGEKKEDGEKKADGDEKEEDKKADGEKKGEEDKKADGEKKGEEETNLIQSSYEVKVKLADLQADPNSPLYSAKSFEDLGLAEDLKKGLYAMKFSKPSKIQERALPLLLADPPQNLIGQSQSGTGKTAAFALTMLSRVDVANPKIQALCLSPARELARQTMDVINQMGKYTKVTTGFAIPEAVERGAMVKGQVVVGTPGTVVDMIRRKQMDVSELRVFVLDEADNMLDKQGLGNQCSRVKKMLPKTAQLVLFSATFPDEVYRYAKGFVPNANEIRLKQEELNVAGIKQLYMDCNSEQDKFNVLCDFYGLLTIASSIIFVARKATADELYKKMTAEGHKVSILHGGLQNEDRDKLIDDFREGRSKVLITTNVLARGIDIPSVSMVVNYDLPLDQDGRPDPSTYLHRIGRTGRFGRVGVSVTLIHDKTSYRQFQQILDHFGEGIEMTKLPHDDWDQVEKIVKKVIK
jgi:ATP-dependent RNA helicase DDX19/DBP5